MILRCLFFAFCLVPCIVAQPFTFKDPAWANTATAAGGTDNNVAFDATVEGTFADTPDPFTLDITPVGVPKGVLVFITHGTEATDLIDGAVTCDGLSMSRVRIQPHGGTEPGASYFYFLGSGIPNETLTISIDHTASTTVKHVVVITVTATGDTSCTVHSGTAGSSVTDPQRALDTTTTTSLRFAVLYSGRDNISGAVAFTDTTEVHNHDFGTFTSHVSRQDARGSGSFTMGWTATANPAAIIGAAIE